MMAGEKAKDLKGTWVKLIRYCRVFLWPMIFALVMAAAASVLQILVPDQMRKIMEELIKGISGVLNMDAAWAVVMLLIYIFAATAILGFLQHRILATVTQKVSKKMRSDISKKINRLPFSYFNRTSYGDVLSRVTNDVDTIGMTLSQSLAGLVSAATMFVGVAIMMFITNWILAVTAVSTSILGFAMMMVIMKRSQKYFVAQQKELGMINGHIEETYTGHTIVKAYNGSEGLKRTFEGINDKLYVSAWRSQFLSGMMMPLMMFIGNFGYVAVCIVGAALTITEGPIFFAVVGAFMLYVRLFTQPLSQFAQAANNLQRTAAASERVFGFLEEGEMEDEGQKVKRLTAAKGDVEFRDVRFGYAPDRTVINGFSAKVGAGQKIAIVGPTGAGKTTMVNLLMRFYEIDGGEILLDGVPINEVPREDVHEQFCMVLQDTWLFEGTIRENIIYSKKGVSDDEVVSACRTVGLHHFIQTLPNGYDTVLNDRASLSEGQKQLLTIARAIIKGSPLLILDEATSSVDTRTERIVQEAMDNLARNRTSFIIAHRLSTIRNADVILVMRDGDIVESGGHDELLAKNGFYAELYNSQFETA
jgi:ATP-binding cassette subfamily B protein